MYPKGTHLSPTPTATITATISRTKPLPQQKTPTAITAILHSTNNTIPETQRLHPLAQTEKELRPPTNNTQNKRVIWRLSQPPVPQRIIHPPLPEHPHPVHHDPATTNERPHTPPPVSQHATAIGPSTGHHQRRPPVPTPASTNNTTHDSLLSGQPTAITTNHSPDHGSKPTTGFTMPPRAHSNAPTPCTPLPN